MPVDAPPRPNGDGGHRSHAHRVTLSNTELPQDTTGDSLVTGEATVLNNIKRDGFIYLYMTNWGGCPQVDCCMDKKGSNGLLLPWPLNHCWDCCPKQLASGCTYASNHTFSAYRTRDLNVWDHLPDVVGAAQPSRNPGSAFIPTVVYNPPTKKYVMWYENFNMTGEFKRCCIDNTTLGCCHGQYSVATSSSPSGGFSTRFQGPGNPAKGACTNYQGDFTVFVDNDGTSGYIVVRHNGFFCIERLDPTFTHGTGQHAKAPMIMLGPNGTFADAVPGNEAPVLFRRGGTYHLLEASGCCGCKGGSTIFHLTAPHALGPYTYQGQVGAAADGSPVTKAQQRSVFAVASPTGGEDTYIHLGNNYVPGRGGAGTFTNKGLLYWYPLQFDPHNSTTLLPLKWQDTVSFDMAVAAEPVSTL